MPTSTYSSGHHLVNRYRIDELLGVGKTAEVYVAQDLSLQRTVVVKVLLPRLAEHEDVRRAFRDRIIRAATLSHPHLARVYDGGQEGGAIFMITEYLTGGSLEDVLASGRRLSVDDGARLAIGVDIERRQQRDLAVLVEREGPAHREGREVAMCDLQRGPVRGTLLQAAAHAQDGDHGALTLSTRTGPPAPSRRARTTFGVT